MHITAIREASVRISRYADPALPGGNLTTSIVALTTDVQQDGEPVVGYGFSSVGRFAQSGLIRERFAPRLLAVDGPVDPFRAWDAMMQGEKPGGHGERCVAVGTLDMALWDAAAKVAGMPLYRFLAERLGGGAPACDRIRVYAAGGYLYPSDDICRLQREISAMLAAGYTRVKIKIGAASLERDLERIDAVCALLPAPDHLAVDAMNVYGAGEALTAARALEPYGLWWFEDCCDPLDFATHASLASEYSGPIAAGEALFSLAEALLLHRYAGLRPQNDVLLFDPVHCYGLVGYLRMVQALEERGWPRSAFWPHGGHLFCQHVVAALGLGGAECNPSSFAPFGGLADEAVVHNGTTALAEAPGIGFERKKNLFDCFRALQESGVPIPPV